ncbi:MULTISPECIES: Hsp20/alpha crystallin family protein [unclassified Saccharicrinis]|uniref:Hsp20/alpha crystallin family protein n=1 Tax=unclassified Saccharicrinis TaxID=2646859 RepID=UPI003D3430EE
MSSEKMDKKEDNTEKIKITRREFCYTYFGEFFTLPNSTKEDGIKASYKNDIVNI